MPLRFARCCYAFCSQGCVLSDEFSFQLLQPRSAPDQAEVDRQAKLAVAANLKRKQSEPRPSTSQPSVTAPPAKKANPSSPPKVPSPFPAPTGVFRKTVCVPLPNFGSSGCSVFWFSSQKTEPAPPPMTSPLGPIPSVVLRASWEEKRGGGTASHPISDSPNVGTFALPIVMFRFLSGSFLLSRLLHMGLVPVWMR